MSKKAKKAKRAAAAEHKLTKRAARKHEHPLLATAGAASEVADQPPLVGIALATLAAGVVLRRPNVVRTGTRMLLAQLLATGAKAIAKNAVDRTRPARALADGKHRAEKGHGADDTGLNSFPSGHTAGAVAVAQAVAHQAPEAGTPVRIGAAMVGAVQLPRGAHYISDVLAGAAIGWAAERIAGAFLGRGESAARRILADRADARATAETAAHPS